MFNWAIKYSVILSFMILLSACGVIPRGMSFIHTATDAALVSTTGRSSTEHVMSHGWKKDCLFARLMDNANVCMSQEEELDYILSKNCEVYTWNWLGLPECKK